ncbi:reverse transcriptase domain-containing protein [Tanacetum coccineum]
MVSKFLSKYFPYSRTLQLRKEILNFWQLPTESVFEAWERFKSFLRKCPDHRILLLNQILTFYNGITMIDQERLMVAAGSNFMRKTPQEAYDLIENMTQHHFQWDAEDQVILTPFTIHSDDDEPSEMTEDQKSIHHLSASPTPFSDPVVASLSLILLLPPGIDDPSEAKNSEIDSHIKGPSDTFLMGDDDIKLNPPMDVDNLVPIPRVSEKPLDSLDPILETSKMTINDPLFDFEFEFTLNSDNPILDIQNKESDESETETIMDEADKRLLDHGWLAYRCGSFQKKAHSKNNKDEADKSLLDHGRLAY